VPAESQRPVQLAAVGEAGEEDQEVPVVGAAVHDLEKELQILRGEETELEALVALDERRRAAGAAPEDGRVVGDIDGESPLLQAGSGERGHIPFGTRRARAGDRTENLRSERRREGGRIADELQDIFLCPEEGITPGSASLRTR
jgi:hypothetical protein